MLRFAKGHGTLNDFVCITDANGTHEPTDELVRLLCDRRAGIGGDGLMRAVPARFVPEWTGDPDVWFMDYRNADGSIAEMCGNGLRVFVRHLVTEGLVDADTTELRVGTRAGLKTAALLPDGRVRLGMGPVTVAEASTSVAIGTRSWQALVADVGNPHAVVHLDDPDGVADVDLGAAPTVSATTFPAGANVEFVASCGERTLQMRVHERGVGETPSCGTGTVAAAAADARRRGVSSGTWTVRVPGGEVDVELADGQAWLTGPAVIVASGVWRGPLPGG